MQDCVVQSCCKSSDSCHEGRRERYVYVDLCQIIDDRDRVHLTQPSAWLATHAEKRFWVFLWMNATNIRPARAEKSGCLVEEAATVVAQKTCLTVSSTPSLEKYDFT